MLARNLALYLAAPAVAVCLAGTAANADPFEVRGTQIEIPPPPGFVRVTKQMDALCRFSQQIVDPENDQLAYYVSEADASAALSGEVPSLERYFIAKVSKQLKSIEVSRREFSQIKKIIKDQNQEFAREAAAIIEDRLQDISKGISHEFDTEVLIRLMPLLPARSTSCRWRGENGSKPPHVGGAGARGTSLS